MGTAGAAGTLYIPATMQFTPFKLAIAAVWLLAVGALAVSLPVTSVAGWITITCFALMPSVFMLRAWRRPTETLSESIQAQIRK